MYISVIQICPLAKYFKIKLLISPDVLCQTSRNILNVPHDVRKIEKVT